MARMEGKRQVLMAAFVTGVVALVTLIIAICSPYWVQSWPRVHSSFKRIGMWEACFAGLVLERDIDQRAHHGCWWTLSSVYDDIRSWMNPPWFILTQIVTTLCLIIEMILLILILVVFAKTHPKKGGKIRPPIAIIQSVAILTFICAVSMVVIDVMFGIMVYMDRGWMPRPDLNYLSWGYGMAVISAFFSIFSSIAMCAYTRIARRDYRGDMYRT